MERLASRGRGPRAGNGCNPPPPSSLWAPPVKRLVVTADDFGSSAEVNEAVGRAHRDGILTAASLMVGGVAAAEAVATARRQGLAVGLHLTLVDGRPVLAPERVPDLVDAHGRFRSAPAVLGVRLAASRRVRDQVRAECAAQVEAFVATGLAIDHLDAHHHLHVHPFVLEVVLALARRHRIPAVRVPLEPGRPPLSQALAVAAMAPWAARARSRLRRAGIATNDVLFGLHASGGMTETVWLGIIGRVPPGLTEVYCHPAATRGNEGGAAELAALLSPAVRAAIERAGIRCVAFGDDQRGTGRDRWGSC